MALKAKTKRLKNIESIFSCRIRKGANRGKKDITSSSKSTGNLVLDFCHAKTSLGNIIVERDFVVVDKSQYVVFVFFKPLQQIQLFCFFGSAPLVFLFFRGRNLAVPHLNKGVVSGGVESFFLQSHSFSFLLTAFFIFIG